MQQLKFNQNTTANKEILKKKSSVSDELLSKKEVKDVIKKLDVGMEEFDYYLGYFLSYYEDKTCCKNCTNLDNCCKEIKGTVLSLVRKEDGSIEREFSLCPKREEQRKINNNYVIRDFGDDFLRIDIDDLENRKGRFDYEKKIIEIDTDGDSEGMFICGPASCR